MAIRSPSPITAAEFNIRRDTVSEIARAMGFAGRVEYRHVNSQTGGAQYGRGRIEQEDLLTVYAEAFDRANDPEDFSLKAILAHERGHQILARHPRIAEHVRGRVSIASEEILASLLGAIICDNTTDRDNLIAKATVALLNHGEKIDIATTRLQELWNLLESLL